MSSLPIAIVGAQITQLRVDHAFTLICVSSAGDVFEIIIEGAFRLDAPGDTPAQLRPDGLPSHLAPALDVLGREIEAIQLDTDERLHIGLTGGVRLSIGPDSEYETWQVVGPRGFRLIARPGGGVAEWARSEV